MGRGVAAVRGGDTPPPIAAGRDFSCVGVAGGGVSCWGDDSVGQLGDGNAAAGPHAPAAVAGLDGITTLAAHWQHTCGLSGAGLLTCWGANSKGQIGDGSTTGPRPPTLINDPSASAPLPMFSQVTTGKAHTCALAASDIYCWGDNGEGQINQTGLNAPVTTPTPIAGMVTDPIWVAAGGQHTCAVSTVGHVACWGADDSGQHDGTIDNASQVFAGAAFSCALAGDGALFCWGDNHFGQLAIGGDTVRPTPAPVSNLAHVGAFAAGGAHNCATADDAEGAPALFCWGANGSGQLGNGSLTDAPDVTRISTTLQPIGIAAGGAHTCAFPADKELRCWGWGASGQLGLAPGSDRVITVPTIKDLVPPVGGDGVFAVATGAAHTCVGATISASVLCFGLDIDGQLGDGQMVAGGPDPVASFLGKPKQLVAGDAHTCALDGAGLIWCWGRGDEGQLGDGNGAGHASPTMVALGNGAGAADAIAAGAAHTCALAGDRVLCWGRNAEGQLGAPQAAPLLAPQPVSGLRPAQAIATGGHHTCAIVDDATVACWGANESGQLGNGDTTSANAPMPVVGLTQVDGIVAGGAHSCAHRTDGTVWCWGANTSGQLGDGVVLASGQRLLARVACE
jgi:alpha-tubulin suppressor-like RCC1 family protein